MTFEQFEPSDSLAEKTYDAIEKADDTGKVVIGVNEVTKAIERNEAELVIVANDVDPKEIIMHLPALSEERDIPYTFVPEKEELGLAAGINVQSAAIAVTTVGQAEEQIDDIVLKSRELLGKDEEE